MFSNIVWIINMQRILKILFKSSSCYKQLFIFSYGSLIPVPKQILKLSKNLQTNSNNLFQTAFQTQHLRAPPENVFIDSTQSS